MRLVLVSALALAGCAPQHTPTYTLYRTSRAPRIARVHVATFASADGDEYNHENCQTVADLFMRAPNVRVRYWCEMGQYRP